jgi:hypothetical protein
MKEEELESKGYGNKNEHVHLHHTHRELTHAPKTAPTKGLFIILGENKNTILDAIRIVLQ